MNKQSNSTEQAVITTTAQNILSFSGATSLKKTAVIAWTVKPKLFFVTASLALVCFSACKKDDKKTEEPPATPITPSDPEPVYGTMNDGEGNSYKTVVIGTQTWTAENLRSTKYNDGTSILNLTDQNQWYSTGNSASTNTLYAKGAYCYYNNADSNKTKYGALYNWYAVNTGKLAPAGWHVPDTVDSRILYNYVKNKWSLSNASYVAAKLMDKSWKTQNTPSDNATGFSALPSGRRNGYGDYIEMAGNYGYGLFWLNNSSGGNYYPYNIAIFTDPSITVAGGSFTSVNGLSVRLVKD